MLEKANDAMGKGILPSGYGDFLENLKARIRQTQIKAVVSVCRELTALYWHIGKSIVSRQASHGWGNSVVDRIAGDLRREFPGTAGFSGRNIWRMRAFYRGYASFGKILPQAVAEIPWGHNILLLEKITSQQERLWYAKATAKYGWSRSVLVHQIESGLYRREGKAVSNFAVTLPKPQSDLAEQTLKDPYVFDFLGLAGEYKERELETALVDHVSRFLLELGAGFAYLGRQVPLNVGSREFFLDLLFYHTKLHCHVVVELKTADFEPEHAGKLNFYLKAVDAQLRGPQDNPTVGLLICKSKDKVVVEYALSDIRKPIGVSEYKLTRTLPKKIQSRLPAITDIEKELRC